ncbi:helix-turn-helix domain-containing protein [Mammaliicoccus sp. JADD-157]|uniref:helix-turn-helix domain-containing protein n=1 Tax=Mammaliicoccus sp. JADD-157 TaxID=3404818 RepID=UPI003BB77810
MEERKPFVMLPKSLVKDEHIKAATIGVYASIAVCCHDQYKLGAPSRATIAKMCGMNNNTLGKHLKVLVDRGYIEITHRFDSSGGGKTSNQYKLLNV